VAQPRTPLEELTDPLAGLRGPTSKGEGARRKRGKGEKRGKKGTGGRAPFRKFLDPPLQ